MLRESCNLYDVFRNGKLFRSFTVMNQASMYLAAARELDPTSDWFLVVTTYSGRNPSEEGGDDT